MNTLQKTPILKDPKLQASHILRSYLNSVAIPVTNKQGADVVSVKTQDGKRAITVSFGENSADIHIKPEDMTSFELARALNAFHAVTNAAGYGSPMPVNRGQGPNGRISYHDDFESVYLRHSILRRSPNKTEKELAPYEKTVKSAARKALFKWRNVFQPMGFGESDLISVGKVYTMSFLHNYASSTVELDNVKLLHKFLQQRFGEFAKITFKKARSATALAQDVRSDRTETDEGETSYIDTYAEDEGSMPDEEYEEDAFILTYPDGTEKTLTIENDGMLGLNMVVSGRLLTKFEARQLVDEIRTGKVSKQRVEMDSEEEGEGVSHLTRKRRAREELHARLNAMPADQREAVLSYAALARDYSPDAQRAARRLCEELACPKCLDKVPSGAHCLKCGIEARPRFGIDYMAFRKRLAAEHHTMADAMTATIPESEARAKVNKATITETTPLSDIQNEAPVEMKVALTQERKAELEKLSAEKAAVLYEKLPEMIDCPKCKNSLHKSQFGIRVAKDKATGIPQRASRQSYCKPCRRPSKGV